MPKAKIMIIDDEEAIIEFVRTALKTFGYDVIWATSGEMAFIQLQKEKPDLIFLDVMMPHMNGWEVLELLKTDEATQSIPVIMLTALDKPKDRLQSAKEGAADFLAKPFNHNHMLEKIRDVLGESVA
ncbi:MAG: response regulator [Gemmatimonadetes bacterium]|nr:MAG: response regulator [Gemmatimonadota bacterium]